MSWACRKLVVCYHSRPQSSSLLRMTDGRRQSRDKRQELWGREWYATKSAFTAPNLCWACALASPVTFLTGDHVMQIRFGQISPSASSTRDLGTRRAREFTRCTKTRFDNIQPRPCAFCPRNARPFFCPWHGKILTNSLESFILHSRPA